MPRLILVLPCYNEFGRLPAEQLPKALAAQPELRLLLVDDGSRDRTPQLLRELAMNQPDRIEVLTLPENRGKAEAVRAGMLRALEHGAELVGYWDADLATPLAALPLLAAEFERRPELEFVCGCRLLRLGADLRRSTARHLVGRVFATCFSQLLGLPVYDTQCGAKLFRAETARKLFAEPFLTRWCFDVELFARFRRDCGREAALTRISEFPLPAWHDVPGSTLTWRSGPRILLELLRLRRGCRFPD